MTSFDFSFFPFYFLVVQKVEFSHPVQYSTSPKYPCFPELLYSTYIICVFLTGRTLSLLQLDCSREEECLVRAKNFSARNPQLFSLSSLLTEVPKNRSHPRLIQEYFSCLFFFFRWRASILLNCSSMDDFVFFSSSKSFCGAVCMKRCRRVGSSGEKVWLW